MISSLTEAPEQFSLFWLAQVPLGVRTDKNDSGKLEAERDGRDEEVYAALICKVVRGQASEGDEQM